MSFNGLGCIFRQYFELADACKVDLTAQMLRTRELDGQQL